MNLRSNFIRHYIADYFVEGSEGALAWDYELTDINHPVTITLPDNCPGRLVNASPLPDASPARPPC